MSKLSNWPRVPTRCLSWARSQSNSDTKKFLFCLNDKDCHLIPTACYQWLVIGQSLISIVLIFFFGLALRNYFKIK